MQGRVKRSDVCRAVRPSDGGGQPCKGASNAVMCAGQYGLVMEEGPGHKTCPSSIVT